MIRVSPPTRGLMSNCAESCAEVSARFTAERHCSGVSRRSPSVRKVRQSARVGASRLFRMPFSIGIGPSPRAANLAIAGVRYACDTPAPTRTRKTCPVRWLVAASRRKLSDFAQRLPSRDRGSSGAHGIDSTPMTSKDPVCQSVTLPGTACVKLCGTSKAGAVRQEEASSSTTTGNWERSWGNPSGPSLRLPAQT